MGRTPLFQFPVRMPLPATSPTHLPPLSTCPATNNCLQTPTTTKRAPHEHHITAHTRRSSLDRHVTHSNNPQPQECTRKRGTTATSPHPSPLRGMWVVCPLFILPLTATRRAEEPVRPHQQRPLTPARPTQQRPQCRQGCPPPEAACSLRYHLVSNLLLFLLLPSLCSSCIN